MHSAFAPAFASAKYLATSTTNARLTAMSAGKVYKLSVSVATFVTQAPSASSPTASAGNGSMLVNPGDQIILHGSWGDTIGAVTATGTGHLTLVQVEPAR